MRVRARSAPSGRTGPIRAWRISNITTGIGERRRAWQHLVAGNELRGRSVSFDIASHEAKFSRLRTAFEPLIERGKLRLRGGGVEGGADRAPISRAAIFIVGFPRSGSSVLQQALAQHDDVYAAVRRPCRTPCPDDCHGITTICRSAPPPTAVAVAAE